MAWVVGLGDEFDRYLELRAEVEVALGSVEVDVRQALTGPGRGSDLVTYGTASARLLYGAFSPTTTTADVIKIASLLADNFVPDATFKTEEWGDVANQAIRHVRIEEEL